MKNSGYLNALWHWCFWCISFNPLHQQYKDCDTMEVTQCLCSIPVCRHWYQLIQATQFSWYYCLIFSWRLPILARKCGRVCVCWGHFCYHLFLSCPSDNTARADPGHVHVSHVRNVIALTDVFSDIKVVLTVCKLVLCRDSWTNFSWGSFKISWMQHCASNN